MKFDLAVNIIINFEGGYVNDSNDPGGETKFGISKRSFPNLNICELTLDQAKEIYRHHYWDMCECDKLPGWLRLMVFDCAVNQGVSRATIYLQRTVGVQPDGIIGSVTLDATYSSDAYDTLKEYSMQRHRSYTQNPRWKFYGKGWSKRLLEISIMSFQELNARLREFLP